MSAPALDVHDHPRVLVVVFAHPIRNSFGGAIVDSIVETATGAGWDVAFHDLYRDGFDPILTAAECAAVNDPNPRRTDDPLVRRYQDELLAADALAVVHPNWWGMPPAILAGWIDRILAPGVAYKLSGGAAGTSAPSLNADALVVTTGDTDADREALVFGDPLSLIWERCVLPYVGAARATRTQVSPVNAMSAQQRHAALDDVAVRTLTLLEDRAARSRA